MYYSQLKMSAPVFGIALFISLMVANSWALPYYEEKLQPYQYEQYYEPYEQYQPIVRYTQIRERRSPQQVNIPPPPPPNRGSVSVTGSHTTGSGGFVRGDYNHKLWESRNGARLDANTYYQRNWGTPGPRQDYGGGVRLTIPLGGRRN